MDAAIATMNSIKVFRRCENFSSLVLTGPFRSRQSQEDCLMALFELLSLPECILLLPI